MYGVSLVISKSYTYVMSGKAGIIKAAPGNDRPSSFMCNSNSHTNFAKIKVKGQSSQQQKCSVLADYVLLRRLG